MVHGSRLLPVALVGAALLGSGCAELRSIGLVRGWQERDAASNLAIRPTTQAAGIRAASAEQAPRPRKGFFAQILPASWFVSEDEPDQQDRARARARVHLSLAQVYEKKNALREAEEAYENALREDPHLVPALLGLARVYQQTGRPDAALELYEQLVQRAPENPSVWNDMGLCYRNLGDLVEAERCLRRAVELDPMKDLYRNNLAYVLASLGYYRQAWEEFRRAVGPAAAHYNLALVAVEQGDRATAVKHATEALALEPKMEPARKLLEQLERGGSQGKPATARAEGIYLPAEAKRPAAAVDRSSRPAARVLGITPQAQ